MQTFSMLPPMLPRKQHREFLRLLAAIRSDGTPSHPSNLGRCVFLLLLLLLFHLLFLLHVPGARSEPPAEPGGVPPTQSHRHTKSPGGLFAQPALNYNQQGSSTSSTSIFLSNFFFFFFSPSFQNFFGLFSINQLGNKKFFSTVSFRINFE